MPTHASLRTTSARPRPSRFSSADVGSDRVRMSISAPQIQHGTGSRTLAGQYTIRTPENGLSQEQVLGITPENLAGPVAAAAGLTPENKELPTSYSD